MTYSLFAEENYRLLHRSPQVDGAYPSASLDPDNGQFTTGFYFSKSTTTSPLEVFDLDGKKIKDWDTSHWRDHGGISVPGKKLRVFTELTICPKPLKVEVCDYNPEGYMYDIVNSTFLYHSPKFARNYPDFTSDGEYMLGKFGWGYSNEGGGEYSPSTGTCLYQVDTGKEYWCREESLSRHKTFLSAKSGIIVGDKAIYDLFSGKRILTLPQFAEQGIYRLVPQKEGMAVIIRAMSPDGRYFVATEGKCDADRVKRFGKEDGCDLTSLTETETYLGKWEKGRIEKKITSFGVSYATYAIKPYYFLPDGLLAVYTPYPPRLRLLKMDGSIAYEAQNDKAAGIAEQAIWRLQPLIDYKNNVIIWPSAQENYWRVYGLDGRLIGEFIWKDSTGRDSHVRGFGMINDKEYFFTVDIVTRRSNSGGVREYLTEVYRGKFKGNR